MTPKLGNGFGHAHTAARGEAVDPYLTQHLAWRAQPFPYNSDMALVVFLRGVNVGGHRTFRPSILARELSDYDVVNVGAAGTFVVRKPGSRAKFRAELLRRLPFETEVVLCDGRDLIALETENPFAAEPTGPDMVR